MAFFQDNLGKLDLNGARDDGVAVASAGHMQIIFHLTAGK